MKSALWYRGDPWASRLSTLSPSSEELWVVSGYMHIFTVSYQLSLIILNYPFKRLLIFPWCSSFVSYKLNADGFVSSHSVCNQNYNIWFSQTPSVKFFSWRRFSKNYLWEFLEGSQVLDVMRKNRLDSRNWGEYFSEECMFFFFVRSFLLSSGIV